MGLNCPQTQPHGLVSTNNSQVGRLGGLRQFYSPLTLVVQVVPRDLGHLLSLEGLPDPIESGAREIQSGLGSILLFLPRLGTTKEGAQFLPSHLLPNSEVPEVAKSPVLSLALLPALQRALAGPSLLEVLSDQGTQQHQEHQGHQGSPSLPETDSKGEWLHKDTFRGQAPELFLPPQEPVMTDLPSYLEDHLGQGDPVPQCLAHPLRERGVSSG